MSQAAVDAQCPADGGRAVRVFEMPATNFNRPSVAPRPRPSGGYTHYGHTHGAGVAPHSTRQLEDRTAVRRDKRGADASKAAGADSPH